MKKTITLYELLELIKDNKAPKYIKHDDVTFKYERRYKDYFDFEGISLFSKDYVNDITTHLDDTVEILPEENDDWEEIEEIDINLGILNMTGTEKYISNHVNKLIKNQKYLKEKLEGKDE